MADSAATNKPAADWTRSAGLGTGPLSVEPYVSPEFFDTVREAVFRRSWLNVGRVEELPEQGSFLVKRVGVLNASILLVRGRDDVIRAFHNVCSHRGNEVVWEESGKAERFFACRFHGWTYSLEGELRGVPDQARFFGLDQREHGLTAVHVQLWRGFMFVHLAAQPEQSLEVFLGDFGRRMADYPFETYSVQSRYTVDIRTNWQAAMDAFRESYHGGFLHSRWAEGNSRARLLDVFIDRVHHGCAFSTRPRPAPTPMEALATKFGASGLYVKSAATASGGLNRNAHPDWFFDCNVVFPNFFLDLNPRSYFTYNFWPESVNRTVFEITTYDRPPANCAEAAALNYSRMRLRSVLLEDLSTLERTQRGLESGAKTQLQASDEEVLIRHGHETVTRLVNEARAERG